MKIRRPLKAVILLAAASVLAACNSSYRTTAPTTVPVPSTGVSAIHPNLVLTPAEPYPNHAIQVTATGFTPRESLVITECANRVSFTRQGDCDLSAIKPVTANASGKVQTTFMPTEGPFGTNHITCSTPRSCLISVSQPTPHSSALATASLTFCSRSKSCPPTG